MKATILKMILPVAAFALASAGAVTTSKTDASLALKAGYRPTGNPTNPCTFVKMCSDTGQQICTVDGTPTGLQLWHQPVANGPCSITVYEP